jgi:hypothetical protein
LFVSDVFHPVDNLTVELFLNGDAPEANQTTIAQGERRTTQEEPYSNFEYIHYSSARAGHAV